MLKRRTSAGIITASQADAIEGNGGDLPSSFLLPFTWIEAGPDADPRGRLRSVADLGGAKLHVEALAVHQRVEGDDTRYSVTDEHAMANESTIEFDCEGQRIGNAEQVWTALGMEGMPETIEIEGRHYAVFMCPFSG